MIYNNVNQKPKVWGSITDVLQLHVQTLLTVTKILFLLKTSVFQDIMKFVN